MTSLESPVSYRSQLLAAVSFAIAMAYVESMVVVYLREIYYPNGFSFPIAPIPEKMIVLEIIREIATIIMLSAVAVLAARKFWERFGWFILMFGVWDIFYYIWLKGALDWPATLFDWDILFLIPLPWIGPVIAPLLIAVEMIVFGWLITRNFAKGLRFRPSKASWVFAAIGTLLLLYSFMWDIEAGLRQELPEPYLYPLLFVGLILYAAAWKTRKAGL